MRSNLWIPVGTFVIAILISLFAGPSQTLHARRRAQDATGGCKHTFIPPDYKHDCVSNLNGVIGSDCNQPFNVTGFYTWKTRVGPEGDVVGGTIYEADQVHDAKSVRGGQAPPDILTYPLKRELVRSEGEMTCCHTTSFSGDTFVSLVGSITPIRDNLDWAATVGSAFANFNPVSDCGQSTAPKFAWVAADIFVFKSRGTVTSVTSGVKGDSDNGLQVLGPSALGGNNLSGWSIPANTAISGSGGVDFTSSFTWTGVTTIALVRAPNAPIDDPENIENRAQLTARCHLIKTSSLHDDVDGVPSE